MSSKFCQNSCGVKVNRNTKHFPFCRTCCVGQCGRCEGKPNKTWKGKEPHCIKCNVILIQTNWPEALRTHSHSTWLCIECHKLNERTRKTLYRLKNPELFKHKSTERMRLWKEKNPEKYKATQERWKLNNPERYKEICINKKLRRKAKLKGCKTTLFKRRDIFERDNWICQLCFKSVPKTYVDYNSQPTLDHIIPVSKYGDHTPENVRLAHLICNSKRGPNNNK